MTSQIPVDRLFRQNDGLLTQNEPLAGLSEQLLSKIIEQGIGNVENMIREQSEELQSHLMIQLGPLYKRPSDHHRGTLVREQKPNSAASKSIGIRVNHYPSKCRASCACSCHKQKSSSSPFATQLFGKMFVGYTGLPVISPKCDGTTCEKAQAPFVSLQSWFPLGFCWSKIIQLQFGYRWNVGPQFSLTTFRSVPDTAPCVEFALNGNIEGLKDLFTRGMASPWDVSVTRGYTLLRWALYGKQYQAVKFLMEQGSDADYRPIAPYDNSPRNKASDFVLQKALAREDIEALRCLTDGHDWIEEQNFSQLHMIVCGLSSGDLEEALLAHPEEINSVDAMARTPLLWASVRGDVENVVTLLSHGADPNILDQQLSSAVSYAAERDRTVCVRLLLEAGAETDPALPDGYVVGSPLNCAARSASDPLILKSLLDFGADVESAGVDGRTSLIHVARTDNASFAMVLLEYGANLNATSSTEQTPLTTAIIHNSHNVLRLLLDRWAEYSECPRLMGPHLLEIAALYADVETLHILTQANHFRLKHGKKFTSGDFLKRLKGRYDVSEKLVTAFEDLLGVIDAEPKSSLNEPDIVEKGLWS